MNTPKSFEKLEELLATKFTPDRLPPLFYSVKDQAEAEAERVKELVKAIAEQRKVNAAITKKHRAEITAIRKLEAQKTSSVAKIYKDLAGKHSALEGKHSALEGKHGELIEENRLLNAELSDFKKDEIKGEALLRKKQAQQTNKT